MRGVFVDASDELASILERLTQPGDIAININRDEDIKSTDLPKVLDGAEIAIVDHTYVPTDVARQCTSLKHIEPRLR